MNEQSNIKLINVRLKPAETSLLTAIMLRENMTVSEAVRQAIRTEAKHCGVYGDVLGREAEAIEYANKHPEGLYAPADKADAQQVTNDKP